MIGNIIDIVKNVVTIKLSINVENQVNLSNLHVSFYDNGVNIIGEIGDINKEYAKITVVGEIKDNVFLPGFNKKPSFKSVVRLVNYEELKLILGDPSVLNKDQVYFGISNIYDNYKINVGINDFFSSHFAILGNTGAGKSWAVARLLQNIFSTNDNIPEKANFVLFDAYGEYTNALSKVNVTNNKVNYKVWTTDLNYPENPILNIPAWLLGVDDLAHLLGVTKPSQLPILEKALKLVTLFKNDDEKVVHHKNDIIARAIQDILLSGKESSKIRDQITAILTKFYTKDLNLESVISQPGYNRTLKQLIFVDKGGKMQEMEIVVDFISKFIIEGLELKDPDGTVMYELVDLEQALEFSLISEGILNSDKVFDDANVLLVRLHSIVNSSANSYFKYSKLISRNDFVKSLTTTENNMHAQIINININYVDDRLAKAITKILSKMIFDYLIEKTNRASEAFHIIIEEAHRYVQNDRDEEVLGYNIFNRITKEGRKYGCLIGLITQRPSELSETTISQCSNFLVLRTLHPNDLDYIKNMVPNVSEMMVEQLKTLKPGNCMAFGSAFKVPVSMYFERPNPEPLSNSANLERIWF